jgi:cytoskeletal protein RodZ
LEAWIDKSKRRCFVDTTSIIIVVLVLVILGAILGLVFARRRRSEQLHDQFGPEYDHTVQTLGDEKKAQTELEERQKHVKTLDIRPLSTSERSRYLAEWAAVQSKFVDEPGQAIVAADRLIMEVMQVRAYPVSDFEQRAADISVTYPALVSNYRAAREIAVKNEQHLADTEELRQAMIYYRSLFDELLGTETAD